MKLRAYKEIEEFIGLGMRDDVLCIITRSYDDGKKHYYPIKIKEKNKDYPSVPYYPTVSDLRLYVDGEEL